MENEIILIDTSILIDYFRKSEKPNSKFVQLILKGFTFQMSAITEYEIYVGATPEQISFWDAFLIKVKVLPFDQDVVRKAILIARTLKQNRNLIDLADLFIAATAIANNLSFATLNRRHFDRIDSLNIVD